MDDNSLLYIKTEIRWSILGVCVTLIGIILWIYILMHKPTEDNNM